MGKRERKGKGRFRLFFFSSCFLLLCVFTTLRLVRLLVFSIIVYAEWNGTAEFSLHLRRGSSTTIYTLTTIVFVFVL